ncbi:methyltransferase, TIGR04325 family [Ramlibacter sp.]|uniref:methyltransferase, TIGR04325 family n=1 Tax=Ramlibacter sp. TaxID=1917967 RepID=UPI00180FDDB1|nr:methyltransferase, TIGR04325 family [Ramlibacter sp.]MBA2673305.1 methyltransferase, TIGR04325 family [Ramlibacter sp.]
MGARSIVRELLPPVLLRALRAARGAAPADLGMPVGRTCPDWDTAAAASAGYGTQEILRRVEATTQRVLAGDAAFERDSVAFARMEHPFALLAGLLRAAAEAPAPLRVLDFGGSLGSTYRQCRGFLSVLPRLHWAVVEQEHVVQAGQARYTTDELTFHRTIDEAAAAHPPHVAIAASSLQYLPDPHAVLAALGRTGARYILIDRTPLADAAGDRVIVQQVPPSIYPASYPCWILARAPLLQALGDGWELLADYACANAPLRTDTGDAALHGWILRRTP